MNIGAFFDLDGTLLPPPSLERRFLRHLYGRRELTVARGARWLWEFLCRAPYDWLAATEGNKTYLAGIPETSVADWAARPGRRSFAFFWEALVRLDWHAEQGHRLFLVSGTLAPLARLAARALAQRWLASGIAPLVSVCASEPVVQAGVWTGGLGGEALCGPAKARALGRLAAQRAVDLSRSYAYGNAWSDRWMLGCVGKPVAVNPSPRLARLALRRGWPVLRWCGTHVLEVRNDVGRDADRVQNRNRPAAADLLPVHHAAQSNQ